MIDLIKHLSVSYKKAQRSTPKGWSGFLNTLSELNIPLSSVNNPDAREQYSKLKMHEKEEAENEEGEMGVVVEKGAYKRYA